MWSRQGRKAAQRLPRVIRRRRGQPESFFSSTGQPSCWHAISDAPCWLQARFLRRPLLHPQVCAPFVNTQQPGEPVPKLDSYSRGGGRFVGNHYIKVVACSSVVSQL